jgi:hypothetical protein
MSLNGLNMPEDVETIVKQKMDERQKENDLITLKQRLTDTEEKLKEAEQYHGMLEKELAELRSKKFHWNNQDLVEFASLAIGGVFQKNAHKIPVIGSQLAGILNGPSADGSQNPPNNGTATSKEGAVTFKEQTEEAPLTPAQQRHLHNFASMEQAFQPEELLTVYAILGSLMKEPVHLKTVAELLNAKH